MLSDIYNSKESANMHYYNSHETEKRPTLSTISEGKKPIVDADNAPYRRGIF